MNKETFCAFPFNTIFLGSDGFIKPCCSSGANLGNINEQSIKEILESPLAKEVRRSIINNEWHSTCSQCYRLEQYGARTERTGVLDKFEEFKDATEDTFKLQKLDFRWSNTCNLACNYCYEYFSSQWSNIKGIKVNSNKDLAEESLFALIDENKGTIENINLLGGEPLLQKQNVRLFDALPDKRYYILTNLSLDLKKNAIGQKLLGMSNANISWGVSFENVYEKYEHVRHGSKWDLFINNLNYLKSLNQEVNSHPLYCAYSAFNLVEFYDWLLDIDVFNGVYWCAIQNLPGQNVFTLPVKLRVKAIDELDKCIEKFGNTKYHQSIESLKDYRTTLLTYMDKRKSMNENEIKYDDFIINRDRLAFIKWIDEIENKYLTKEHKFKDLWPDVYNIITEEN